MMAKMPRLVYRRSGTAYSKPPDHTNSTATANPTTEMYAAIALRMSPTKDIVTSLRPRTVRTATAAETHEAQDWNDASADGEGPRHVCSTSDHARA
jgi:hypothetical protein